ncbi:FAD-binding oxidoreductase [Acetobacteraceae bacterium H6797]|nr:FAD-binding oxidoreductase [Acetobacteraceae bacterium H6797]
MNAPYAIAGLIAELGSVPHLADADDIRQFARQYFTADQALRRRAQEQVADLVLRPRNADELARCVSLAFRYRVPLTLAAGRTAEDGASIPLEGGIQLDMTGIAGLIGQKPGSVRVLAGTRMAEIDRHLLPAGWELRQYPTLRAQATIGGFIAGGIGGGVGSCNWGMLPERGNILGLQVMSIEAEPRLLELRGRDIDLALAAAGTNGIITEVELPTAPAWEWQEITVGFPGFHAAAEFAVRLGHEDAMPRKLISLLEWPLPELMRGFPARIQEGHSAVNCMIAAPFRESFEDLVAECGGLVVAEAREGDGQQPLSDFAWGHVLHQVRRNGHNRTGVAAIFGPEDLLGDLLRVQRRFGTPSPLAAEIVRMDGQVAAIGSPLAPGDDAETAASLVATLRHDGIALREGRLSRQPFHVRKFGERDRAFKQEMDPQGLLNPGRLSFDMGEATPLRQRPEGGGWSFRRAT